MGRASHSTCDSGPDVPTGQVEEPTQILVLFLITLVACGARTDLEPSASGHGSSRPGPIVVAITAGDSHTCALLSSGTVACWGGSGVGELGNGTKTDSSTPVAVSGLGAVTAISAGEHHTCALRSNGTVACWGDNSVGQLGNGMTVGPDWCVAGTRACSSTPVAVSNLNDATAISAGLGHSCAVLSNGTAACWGDNRFGQLGNATTISSPTPVPVANLRGATAVSAAWWHTCALLAEGTVACWGENASGQLGNGSTNGPALCPYPTGGPVPCSTTPVTVPSLGGVRAISGRYEDTCALLSGGTVDCWGDNNDGHLGNGTNGLTLPDGGPGCWCSATPGIVTGLRGVTAISDACAVLSDGTVACWGNNTTGQLGNGTTTNSFTPVAVSNLSGVSTVCSGGSHACALLSNGTVECWGDNSGGQLGDGTRSVSNLCHCSVTPAAVRW